MFMRKAFAVVTLAAGLLVGSAFAVDEYKIDPNHSSANFSVRHMKVSTVKGRFSDVQGVINYDPQDVTRSTVKAVIKTSTITTDNAKRDDDLKSPNFFDVTKYPEIKFESTKIEKRGEQYVAIGNLTIKDVTKQVELPFTVTTAELGGKKRLGSDATLTINRNDYHVDWNKMPGVVDDTVKIELNIEAGQPAAAAATK
jgi:polyisoprenoid-binding protein YceI